MSQTRQEEPCNVDTRFVRALPDCSGCLEHAGRQLRNRQADSASHLADADRVIFVLGNLQNHVDGVGGPGMADIRLVVHGPALRAFHALAAEDYTVSMMQKLVEAGVGFDACANTMKAQGVKLDDLIPGFVVAPKGGVVRLAELQQSGYAYLRP